jgi:hypothetical protein
VLLIYAFKPPLPRLTPRSTHWRFRRHHRIAPCELLSDRWGVNPCYDFASIFFVKFPNPLETARLEYLDLHENQLEGTLSYPCTLLPRNFAGSFFLTGEIPVSLGNCINLTVLRLDYNKLQGKCSIHTTLLPGNLPSKILHTRTFTGTESSKKTLGQQLPDCEIFV